VHGRPRAPASPAGPFLCQIPSRASTWSTRRRFGSNNVGSAPKQPAARDPTPF
jgi:hypothetical protein